MRRTVKGRSRGGRWPAQRDRRVGSTEPSPVEASSHEGLKVDGAGERCKGAAQMGKESGMDRYGGNGGRGMVLQTKTQTRVRNSRVITR